MGSPTQSVACPHCRQSNAVGAKFCVRCRVPISLDDATMTGIQASGWSALVPSADFGVSQLEMGTVIADRYEIIQLLGKGGMGAVYKARDRELDRVVALKVIRPELADRETVLQRFKQELILARQITHRNVIRIFDLGISGNLKFITMEYLDGSDLASLLDQRRFTPEESLHIVRQVCRALEAAHAEGVIHRDLKPHNIMIADDGRVAVMDFGMARSLESAGLTQTGAMMGTPAYMSPEQAEGKMADARSDIFAIGIILYEMLTGAVPFKADTILATLLKRTQGPPVAPRELNAALPQGINDVVLKCLEVDPAQRYQSASDLLRNLDGLAGGDQPAAPTVSPVVLPPVPARSARPQKKWILAGVAALALAVIGGGVAVWGNLGGRQNNSGKPVSVLVADFDNATGDSIFNGTLEPMFTLALEGAPFISAVRRDTAMQAAREVRPDATVLTESLARLVAVRQGIAVVVVGSVRQSGKFVIRVRALDGATGREIAQRETTASDKEGVLKTVGKLAAPIRTALGDATPESKQIAAAETFTAGSLEAAQAYGEAQAQRFSGKTEAAANSYLKAISLDPKFGSAYASLAAVSNNLGQRDKAVKLYQEALTHIERMTDREKYRTRGGYYLVTMDPQKAGDEFAALVRLFPADYMGYSSLAYADYLRHDMRSALEAARRALELYPNNVPYRNNLALYALYAGQFDVAMKESSASIAGNPGYIKGYVTLAAAQLGDGHPEEAAQTYERLRGVSALGASFASSGKADLALYRGREEDAVRELQSGIAADLENNNTTAAAKKLLATAEALLLLGRKSQAAESVDRAVKLAKEDVLFPAARLYAQAGQDAKASGLAADLGRKFEPLPQALSKLVAGEVELAHGRTREAISLLQASAAQSDMWLARFDLARAYLAAEAFPQADSELDLCLRRRGEATDVYMNDEQTSHYLPPIYYYLGRVREGLRSSGAVDSFKQFLGFKDAASQDSMVRDARRRAFLN